MLAAPGKRFPETLITYGRDDRAFRAVYEAAVCLGGSDPGLIDLHEIDHHLPGTGLQLWHVYLSEKFRQAAERKLSEAPWYARPFVALRIRRADDRRVARLSSALKPPASVPG